MDFFEREREGRERESESLACSPLSSSSNFQQPLLIFDPITPHRCYIEITFLHDGVFICNIAKNILKKREGAPAATERASP